MAHEITATDSTFSVREMPWMGLLDGQVHVLPDNPTRAEAQELVHPWEPLEVPVFARETAITPEGVLTEQFVEIDGQKAIQRSDNGDTLGVVSDTYGVVTNTELWDVAEAVGNIGVDIEIETGGSLDGGRKVWALLKLAEPFVVKGDPNGATMAYLALQNGHVANASFRAQAINTRIVCANTSAAADVEAKRNGYEFRFNHTSGVSARIEEAKAAVAMWREGVHVWHNAMEVLADTRVTAEQREEFVQRFQPMPPNHLITDRVRNNVETARQELRGVLNSPTCVDIQDNAFGLFQASVEWSQHVRKVKGKDERSRMESHFKRHIMSDNGLRQSTLSLIREVAHV